MCECKTHCGLYFNTDGYSTEHRMPSKVTLAPKKDLTQVTTLNEKV